MKRSIALLTALMLCAAMLMGCGKEADIAGKTTPLSEQEAPKSEPTPTTEPTAEPEPTTTAEPMAEPEPAATAEPELEEHKLSLGRMEGGVYENSYAGFGCKLDAGWTFAGAEELQEIPEEVQKELEGIELGDIEYHPTIMDMMATNEEMLGAVNVQYTRTSVKDRLVYALLSEDDLIDGMLEQKDTLIEACAQTGITVKTLEKAEVSFLGETHKALYTAAEESGVESYTVQILDYTRGQYCVGLTVVSYVEDRTQELLDLFYKVD